LADRVRETKSSIGRDSLSLSPRSRDLELASSLFLRERERKKASWYNAQDSQEPFNFGGETLPLSKEDYLFGGTVGLVLHSLCVILPKLNIRGVPHLLC
jgi:hypothetical protein